MILCAGRSGVDDDSNAAPVAMSKHAAGELLAAATQLRGELGTLEQKHHSERNKCLEVWLKRHEEVLSKLQGFSNSSSLSAPAPDNAHANSKSAVSQAYQVFGSPGFGNDFTEIVPKCKNELRTGMSRPPAWHEGQGNGPKVWPPPPVPLHPTMLPPGQLRDEETHSDLEKPSQN